MIDNAGKDFTFPTDEWNEIEANIWIDYEILKLH